MGTWNFEILAEDFNAGSPSSFTVRMKYLFAFQFWYWKVCVKTRWGEWGRGRGRKHCFVNFCSLALLNLSMGEGLCVGKKVLFRASWNLIFFSRDLTGHNKHDSFWVVALTEYFYILSFLQPTGKQITISINIFTYFCCCSNSLHRKPAIWKLMNYMLCTHGITCNLRK